MNTEQFFDFELKNGLFDIVDSRGLRPWEAVRYYVYSRVYSNREPVEFKTSSNNITLKRVLLFIRRKISFIVYILQHLNSPYLFLLCSRDKKDGIYYDKISGNLFDCVDKKKTFAIDSCFHDFNYKYKGLTCENSLLLLINKFVVAKYDFSYILNIIKSQYPTVKIEIKELEKWYATFLTQYYCYKILFKLSRTKKMFMVQNGVLKGIFAAANELGVEVIEFQHGQISINHPAYSYPSELEVDSSKIYHPSALLVFGEFWTRNRNYPGVKNIIIGNEFYYKDNSHSIRPVDKHFLVISDRFEGGRLVKYVKSILDIDSSFSFDFKLHPNQYEEKNYYEKEFYSYKNVKVVSDEKTIIELLSISEGILVVQSTVELEALRDGKKVFVIKEGSYRLMDFVLSEPGIYLIDSANIFIDKYKMSSNDKIIPRGDLFDKYNTSVVANLIN